MADARALFEQSLLPHGIGEFLACVQIFRVSPENQVSSCEQVDDACEKKTNEKKRNSRNKKRPFVLSDESLNIKT